MDSTRRKFIRNSLIIAGGTALFGCGGGGGSSDNPVTPPTPDPFANHPAESSVWEYYSAGGINNIEKLLNDEQSSASNASLDQTYRVQASDIYGLLADTNTQFLTIDNGSSDVHDARADYVLDINSGRSGADVREQWSVPSGLEATLNDKLVTQLGPDVDTFFVSSDQDTNGNPVNCALYMPVTVGTEAGAYTPNIGATDILAGASAVIKMSVTPVEYGTLLDYRMSLPQAGGGTGGDSPNL